MRKARARAPVEVPVPGDKSISHRALILSALAPGRARIRNLNEGADVAATATCLRMLGADVRSGRSNDEVEVHGCAGAAALHEPAGVLDAGNSGTTARILLGVLAGGAGAAVITGDASLLRRPMLRVVAPLRQMGAILDGRAHGDRLPLLVRATRLAGIDHELAVPSAQVKTALLLAGLGAEGTTSVTEPVASRDHTERMLEAVGIELSRTGTTTSIDGGQDLAARDWHVPGDVSAAMFLVVGALLRPDARVTIPDVGINPTRTAGLDVLRSMGGDVDVVEEGERSGEPVGKITARHSRLHAARIEGDRVPALIDELPILAVAAAMAEGDTVIRDAGELRVKESDRIARVVEGLRVIGADAEQLPDGMIVRGPATLRAGTVDGTGDHRIAMAFAVAGLLADVPVTVTGWSSTETSFPGFLDALGQLR